MAKWTEVEETFYKNSEWKGNGKEAINLEEMKREREEVEAGREWKEEGSGSGNKQNLNRDTIPAILAS